MTRAQELKQACLDLNAAAMTLFDSIEAHGVEAPWDDMPALLAIQAIAVHTDHICGYFKLQAAMRMEALSPGFLAREAKRTGIVT